MAAAFLLSLYLSFCLRVATAQSISTNTPLPPLQWISLSPFLQGSTAPPPLKDAALGYDESSRTLVVFGGESEGGFVQSQTYLLDMNTLRWSIPSPPTNLDRTPPGRSSAISGVDIAASNRHAFVVIGGKGSNSVALSDVWAFDFTNRFWSEIQPTHPGPPSRWGASGGIDIRSATIQDPVLPGPNNTLYLAGGFDGKTAYPLSDVWRLNISGILSANLPNSIQASWEKVPVEGTLPAAIRQGGTITGQQIVSAGGCNSILGDSNDSSCALQDSYVLDVLRGFSIAPGPCVAPRLDPVLVPNFNTYSTNFASQVFLALGTYNRTLWDAGDGLEKGEVDVLDVNTGSWSRIIPSGDPGSTGGEAYPTPREGAASFSYDRALVGSARNGISDTLIFGGRDTAGHYLSDMWILRSYRDSLTSSGSRWTGYGNGRLQTGPDANGAGVTIQYMTECASPKQAPPSSGDDSAGRPSEPQPLTPPPSTDTSLAHKLLSLLSLALLLLTFILLRAIPSLSFFPPQSLAFVSILAAALAVGAYAVGIAGFALSFTSLKILDPEESSSDRAAKHLSTPHSKAALAFFLCLYIATPLLLLAFAVVTRFRSIAAADAGSGTTELRRTVSGSTGEKLGGEMTPGTPSINGLYSPGLYSPPTSPSPRPRTQSYTMPRRSAEGMSTDGEESSMSAPPTRGFVVLNRPRGRLSHPPTGDTLRPPSQSFPSSRSLGEIDWLLRRRSLNAVGELDYAISVAHNAQRNSASAEATVPPSLHSLNRNRDPPSSLIVAAYILAQIGFLGLNVLTLIAFWKHAHRALFAVFLVCVVAFYVLLFFIPRRLHSEEYFVSLLTGGSRRNSGKDPEELPAVTGPHAFPSQAHGPYLHTPPFIARMDSSPGGRPMSMATEDDDDDDDVDDDTRQRMIEDEMSRRDVSIITMPKRRLTVANPS